MAKIETRKPRWWKFKIKVRGEDKKTDFIRIMPSLSPDLAEEKLHDQLRNRDFRHIYGCVYYVKFLGEADYDDTDTAPEESSKIITALDQDVS